MSRVPIQAYRRLPRRMFIEEKYSNHCLDFNGINRYLRIGSGNVALPSPFQPPFTIYCWFNPLATGAWLMGAGQIVGGEALRISYRATNDLVVYYENQEGTSSNGFSTVATTPLDRWAFGALVLNPPRYDLWLNLNETVGAYIGTPRVLRDDFRIGVYLALVSFEGKIDEVGIIPSDVTANQIRNIFHRGVARRELNADLTLRMEEGTGLTAYDESGNGNDATLVNNPVWTNVAKHELLAESGV